MLNDNGKYASSMLNSNKIPLANADNATQHDLLKDCTHSAGSQKSRLPTSSYCRTARQLLWVFLLNLLWCSLPDCILLAVLDASAFTP
jgi:hypothetical protein